MILTGLNEAENSFLWYMDISTVEEELQFFKKLHGFYRLYKCKDAGIISNIRFAEMKSCIF